MRCISRRAIKERKGQFRTLVLIHSIRMKTVLTTTCRCVVQRNLKIVLSKKPTKRRTTLPLASVDRR